MSRLITIGVNASNNIRINDPSGRVSRNHASLHIAGNRLKLEDHSANGTTVNGRRISHTTVDIRQGDEIILGGAVKLSWHEVNRHLHGKKPKGSGKSMALILTLAGVAAIALTVVILANREPDDGSQKAENCRCRLFNPEDNSFTWNGDCNKGYADGFGTIEWISLEEKYEGQVSNGYITGKGRHYHRDVLLYEGEFKNAKWDGYGTRYDSDLTIIRQGVFIDGYFRDERHARDLCNSYASKVIADVFLSGADIHASLISYVADRNNEKWEVTFDLSFKGILDGYCMCRIVANNQGYRFLRGYSNNKVEGALMRKGIVNGIIDFIFN